MALQGKSFTKSFIIRLLYSEIDHWSPKKESSWPLRNHEDVTYWLFFLFYFLRNWLHVQEILDDYCKTEEFTENKTVYTEKVTSRNSWSMNLTFFLVTSCRRRAHPCRWLDRWQNLWQNWILCRKGRQRFKMAGRRVNQVNLYNSLLQTIYSICK